MKTIRSLSKNGQFDKNCQPKKLALSKAKWTGAMNAERLALIALQRKRALNQVEQRRLGGLQARLTGIMDSFRLKGVKVKMALQFLNSRVQ
jgi:hypothetical protein